MEAVTTRSKWNTGFPRAREFLGESADNGEEDAGRGMSISKVDHATMPHVGRGLYVDESLWCTY